MDIKGKSRFEGIGRAFAKGFSKGFFGFADTLMGGGYEVEHDEPLARYDVLVEKHPKDAAKSIVRLKRVA